MQPHQGDQCETGARCAQNTGTVTHTSISAIRTGRPVSSAGASRLPGSGLGVRSYRHNGSLAVQANVKSNGSPTRTERLLGAIRTPLLVPRVSLRECELSHLGDAAPEEVGASGQVPPVALVDLFGSDGDRVATTGR